MSPDSDRLPAERPPLPSGGPRWRVVYVITYLAMLPLLGLALALWWHGSWRAELARAAVSYTAMLASFIGAIHWGVALRYMATHAGTPTFQFVWGPVPAYSAWLAMMLLEAPQALLVLAAIGLAIHAVDMKTWPGAGLKPWLPLRQQVSVVMVAACLIGAAGALR